MALITFSYYATNVVYSIFIHEVVSYSPPRGLQHYVILAYLFSYSYFSSSSVFWRCGFRLKCIAMRDFLMSSYNCCALQIYEVELIEQKSKNSNNKNECQIYWGQLVVFFFFFFPLTTIFRKVQVYTSNINNVEVIDLNLGLGCCSHCEMILTLTRLSLLSVGVTQLVTETSTLSQLTVYLWLRCHSVKKFCQQSIFCVVCGWNVWGVFLTTKQTSKSILAVSFLLLFGEPCFFRNKLPDENVSKNHSLFAAEVFVKESWQSLKLFCNFSTCFVFRHAFCLFFIKYTETSSA